MEVKEIIKKLEQKSNGDLVIQLGKMSFYRVTPLESMILCLKSCHPDHTDDLLDIYNYLYRNHDERETDSGSDQRSK